MKAYLGFTLSIVIFLASLCASAAAPTDEEIATIKKDMKSIMKATDEGDVSLIISSTHPSVMKLIGGEENFKAMLEGTLKQLKAVDAKLISFDAGEPDETYKAGNSEICFVPQVTVMEIQGQRVKSAGYMIAIRDKGESKWRYIDGSAFRENQAHLWTVLPDLPRDVRLPASFIEMQ